jgi:hypothetical protein
MKKALIKSELGQDEKFNRLSQEIHTITRSLEEPSLGTLVLSAQSS